MIPFSALSINLLSRFVNPQNCIMTKSGGKYVIVFSYIEHTKAGLDIHFLHMNDFFVNIFFVSCSKVKKTWISGRWHAPGFT